MSLQSYLKRVQAISRWLHPSPKLQKWMPGGVYMDNEGNYLPGSQEVHERCIKAGINPDIYTGINPEKIGSKP